MKNASHDHKSITPAPKPAPWWTTSNTRCNTYINVEKAASLKKSHAVTLFFAPLANRATLTSKHPRAADPDKRAEQATASFSCMSLMLGIGKTRLWAPESHEAQEHSLSAVQKLPHFSFLECLGLHIKHLPDIYYYPALYLYLYCGDNIFTLGVTSFLYVSWASVAKSNGKEVWGAWRSLKIDK